MNLENFYSGFGILLVYFTLIWQANRSKGIEAYEKATQLLASIAASEDNKRAAKKANKAYLSDPLNISVDIISLAGIIAFITLIVQNWCGLRYSVSTIVLFAIALMHVVISIDLWRLNLRLFVQTFKLTS